MLAEICAISAVKFDEDPRRKKYSNAGRKLDPGLCVGLDMQVDSEWRHVCENVLFRTTA